MFDSGFEIIREGETEKSREKHGHRMVFVRAGLGIILSFSVCLIFFIIR